MIQLVTPEYLVTMQNNLHKLAEGVLRPISRKYDEAEHEYPKELDMFKNIKVMARPKKKKEGETSSSGEEKKPKRGANLGMVATIEAMCWGDAALLL